MKYIGIFDSGFGGLTILKDIILKLPEYDYLYLGDSLHAPYGSRSQEQIYDFSKDALQYLFNEGCELVIFACNTASGEALRSLQKEYMKQGLFNQKVIGVTIPIAQQAAISTKNGRIGIMATDQTVKSEIYVEEIKKLNQEVDIYQKSCPQLVPLIENGEHDREKTRQTLKEYIDPLIEKKVDTIVLGCTHYGILEDKIQRYVGKDVTIISGGSAVADSLESYLHRHPEIKAKISKNAQREFRTSGQIDHFNQFAGNFFGSKITAKKMT